MTFPADSALADAVRESPNQEERRDGRKPDMLLLHYTGMPEARAALDRLCDPKSKVSCHYFVFEDGRIVQLVPEARRAWHAGVSSWGGETDINSCSIGIEIANPGHDGGYPDFPDAQMDAVEALAKDVVARHAIPGSRVLAHSDVAPGRKQDPGEKFDWARLASAGIGLAVSPDRRDGEPGLGPGAEGDAVAKLQGMLARIGYGVESTGVYDPQTCEIVRAFQRHYRQSQVDGIADSATIGAVEAVLKCI